MEKNYDIWFARLGISNRIKLKLLENFKTSDIWKMNRKDFLDLGLKEITINQILKENLKEDLEKYEANLKINEIELIKFDDDKYPEKLKNIPDKPTYIFVKGNSEILNDDSVAIIGSRLCSEEGKKIAFNTAKELGDRNVNTVSGLAIRHRYICTYWKLKK